MLFPQIFSPTVSKNEIADLEGFLCSLCLERVTLYKLKK